MDQKTLSFLAILLWKQMMYWQSPEIVYYVQKLYNNNTSNIKIRYTQSNSIRFFEKNIFLVFITFLISSVFSPSHRSTILKFPHLVRESHSREKKIRGSFVFVLFYLYFIYILFYLYFSFNVNFVVPTFLQYRF